MLKSGEDFGGASVVEGREVEGEELWTEVGEERIDDGGVGESGDDEFRERRAGCEEEREEGGGVAEVADGEGA